MSDKKLSDLPLGSEHAAETAFRNYFGYLRRWGFSIFDRLFFRRNIQV